MREDEIELDRLKGAPIVYSSSISVAIQQYVNRFWPKVKSEECGPPGQLALPLTQLCLFDHALLEDLVVTLQQGVMLRLELLQLCAARLQVVLTLLQPRLELLQHVFHLLPNTHTHTIEV